MGHRYKVKNNDNAKIFQECYDELSLEAKLEINKILRHMKISVQYRNERIQFSHTMGGELLVALIRGGYLPGKENGNGKQNNKSHAAGLRLAAERAAEIGELKTEIEQLRKLLDAAKNGLRSYAYGNSSPELALEIIAAIEGGEG